VDVKSKSEIHGIMKRLARQGLSIIMISDDIGEIISASNRVVIMNAGRVTLEAETKGITAGEISGRILAEGPPRQGETR
jgi:simple sugar transport system ATP-binding protein